jgi:hypothetical protein
MYENYYVNQSGSGIPVFTGYRGQRGHGIGNFLSGVFRSAVPMIKKGLGAFGKQALRTGLEIANDVVDGHSLKDSATERAKQGIKTLINPDNFIQSQSVERKRQAKRKSKVAKRKKRGDIFD